MIYISVSLVVLFPLIVLILFISWKTNSKKQENNNLFTAIKEDNRACALTESKENRCKIIEDSFTAEHLPKDSVALLELRICIKNLSAALHELYELMNADMSQVNDFWKDPKYEEFVFAYRPSIDKCEEIFIRYDEWCKRILDPRIEIVINIDGDSSRLLSAAEIIARFKKANEVLKNKMAESNIGTGGGSNIGGDSNRPLSSAEKMARFKKANEFMKNANEFMKNKIAEATPGPQGSGFAAPQNKRPRLSPLQMKILRDGKER